MANTTLKKIFLLLLLLTLSLVTAYHYRAALILGGINHFIADKDVQLQNISGLELDWRSLRIQHLSLITGSQGDLQTFNNITLKYALVTTQLQSLVIDEITLTGLDRNEETTKTRSPSSLLDDMIPLLGRIPLKSLTIKKLSLPGLLNNKLPTLALHWQQTEAQQLLDIQAATISLQLALESIENKQLAATFTATQAGQPLATIALQLEKTASGYQLNANTHLTLAQLQFREIAIQDLQLKLPIKINLQQQQLAVSIATGQWLSIAELKIPTANDHVLLQQLAINSPSSLTLNYQLDSEQLSIQLEQLQIMLPQVKAADFELATLFNLSALQVSGKSPALQGSLQLQTDSLNLHQSPANHSGLWLPALALSSAIKFDQQSINAITRFLSDQKKPLLTINASHQLDSHTGQALVTSNSMPFNDSNHKLSNFFSSWPFPADIQSGQFSLRAELQWHSQQGELDLSGKIHQQLEQITGFYQNIAFTGLDTTLELDLLASGQFITPQPMQISLASLDAGLSINNITAALLIDSTAETLKLKSFEAQLLGGSLHANNTVYTKAHKNTPLLLVVNSLQIEQALSLAAYHAVTGTGSISGMLPLTLSPDGLIIHNGQLAVVPPGGVLRYQANTSIENMNPSMKLVSQALSNYHYQTLSATAQYDENGDLALAMKIRGHNPDMNNGQQINLNLNLSDNIPSLLRSLQASGKISEALEKNL